MANPSWLNKYLTMKSEVKQIFNDLEAWQDHCRFNLLKFDPADLYKSREYKEWQNHLAGRQYRRDHGNKERRR